jgi:hypothetical protein
MSNTMTAIIPKLLAQGLLALRQQAVMPRLVNRGYEVIAGRKGSSIDVPIPSAVAAVQVAPATVPPANADMAPTSVNIPLDQWWEAPFYLTDKEVMDVMDGIVPMQASEAIKSLANKVDVSCLDQGKKFAGFAGTAGTTPFATDLKGYLDARKVLNRNLAPMDNRSVVLDVDAEANAIGLRAFQDAAFRGDTQGIINGQIGYKLGAMWTMDQNVGSFTPGTAANATTNAAGYAVGATVITLASAGTGTLLVGDIIKFAGDPNFYSIVSGDADVSNGGTFTIGGSGLKQALPASATAITVQGTGSARVQNLLFHRDAIALASRPLETQDLFGLGNFQSALDPISGLVLRLEITRQHKQTRFSYDILWGVQCVRPELGCVIAG